MVIGGVSGVCGYADRAGCHDCHVGDHPFGPVFRNDGNTVARLDAEVAQTARQG